MRMPDSGVRFLSGRWIIDLWFSLSDLLEEVCDFLAGLLRGINRDFSAFLRASRYVFGTIRRRVAAKLERVLGAIGGFDHQLSSATIDFLDRSFSLLQTGVSELVDFNRRILGSSLC